jgi:uncharacterized membrane protein YciS (DUF1049 family)
VTALLVGFATGLLIAAVIVAYHIRRAIAQRQLEHQIPELVKRANRAARDDIYEQVKATVHFLLWEDRMEDSDGSR